jgi:phosphate-selective porin OprO/OprP
MMTAWGATAPESQQQIKRRQRGGIHLMRKRTTVFLPSLLGATLAVLILPAKAVHAQSKASTDKKDQEIELLKSELRQLERRVNALEELRSRVSVIDRKLEAQGETQEVRTDTERTKALEMPTVRASDEGFRLSSPNDDYRIRFGGVLQSNGRFFTSGDDKNISSTFYVNKARPIISGAVAKYFEYQIMPDFGQGKVILQDAWANFGYTSLAQLQLGKYKAYVNLERLQPDPALDLIQRSEVQNLVPNRDIGLQVNGLLFNQRLSYQLALMNGVPNNTASSDFDNNDGKDFVGRVFLTPFKPSENEWLKGLGVGLAGTYGNESGNTTSVYRTWGQSTWFTYNNGVTANGARGRLDAQAYYYWRQLGLMAEYAQDDHALKLATETGNRTQSFTDNGYMAQISYYLTGENASYGMVSPLRPLDLNLGELGALEEGGLGAFELAARISNVATDTRQFQLGFANPSVSAKTATEFALGINWILNNNVKYGFDYADTYFYGGAGTTAASTDRPAESVFESQLQIAF